MNPMELVYFSEDGRLYLDHDCEMCEKYPIEDLNSECLECGVSRNDLIELESHIANTNRAIDFFNSKAKISELDVHNTSEVVTAELNLSHVSMGGNDCDKIVFSDFEDTGIVSQFADYIRQDCVVVVYPKGLDEENMLYMGIF